MTAPFLPSRDSRVRLVSLTTTAMSGMYLQKGQLSFLREQGVEVVAMASPSEELRRFGEREQVEVIPVPMAREIQPAKDMLSLFRLWRVLVRLQPEIVNAGTPKAGLLGMLAAWLAGVPVRIYTQRGLRLETCRGWKLWLLTWAERLACHCATRVVFVSHSLRAASLERRLVRPAKAVVIGDGSSNGVNSEPFLAPIDIAELNSLRTTLGIPTGAPVVGFVGRLTRDKGIEELWAAFSRLQQKYPAVQLLVVGDFESGDPVNPETVTALKSHPNVVITGFVSDTSSYYRLMSVLAFPSFREGFPNVPLEAACAGIPTVGFRATGTVDAIQHGVTGTLVGLYDTDGLQAALENYLADSKLRQRHGEAARWRAMRDFAPQRIWEGLLELYQEQLSSLGRADSRTSASVIHTAAETRDPMKNPSDRTRRAA